MHNQEALTSNFCSKWTSSALRCQTNTIQPLWLCGHVSPNIPIWNGFFLYVSCLSQHEPECGLSDFGIFHFSSTTARLLSEEEYLYPEDQPQRR